MRVEYDSHLTLELPSIGAPPWVWGPGGLRAWGREAFPQSWAKQMLHDD